MTTIGIDLGMTNTIAAIEGDIVSLREGGESATVLPSVVACTPGGAVLVGASARRRRAIDAQNTLYSAKRVIGRRWHASAVNEFRDSYPFEMVEAPDGCCAFVTRKGVLTPVEVATAVVKTLVKRGRLEARALHAVVGVPSEFGADEREATIEAVRQAGFAQVAVMEEPVAIARAYAALLSERLGKVMIYDIGGGTLNIAIVDCTGQPGRVLASGGDLYLGGDDIDRTLARWVADECRQRYRWDLRNDPEVWDRLVAACEEAKIRLSLVEDTRIEIAEVDPAAPDLTMSFGLDRGQLMELCSNLVRRTFSVCDEVLGKACVKVSELDHVFTAGGTTQLPMVQAALEDFVGRPARCVFDPMEVVAIGASLTNVS